MNAAAARLRGFAGRRTLPRRSLRAARPWLGMLLVGVILPWLFRDYAHARDNGFMTAMFSQMGMMIIFALSYNMLMGEAGLLSFCHAVFFGFGGYCVAHFLNAAASGFPLPLELMPLAGGLCGLGLAAVFGAMATKQRTTAFAMITFGIGELVVTAAIMFQAFLRRRERHYHRPAERVEPVRRQLRAWAGGLLPDRRLDPARRPRDVLSARHPARADGQRLPRQLRARPVRRLRPAHGAVPAVRVVRPVRRHRRRALCHHLRDRHLRRRQRAAIGQRAADGLHRRRRQLRRAGDRRRPDHPVTDRAEPDVELLARLCRPAVHRHGHVRAHRDHRHPPRACADRSAADGLARWRFPISG